MSMYEIIHDTVCEQCGANLMKPNAIEVFFSDGSGEINSVLSEVDAEGLLSDPSGQISIGQHSRSVCVSCEEQLDEH